MLSMPITHPSSDEEHFVCRVRKRESKTNIVFACLLTAIRIRVCFNTNHSVYIFYNIYSMGHKSLKHPFSIIVINSR